MALDQWFGQVFGDGISISTPSGTSSITQDDNGVVHVGVATGMGTTPRPSVPTSLTTTGAGSVLGTYGVYIGIGVLIILALVFAGSRK